jgi:POT family proton-dependent oligopeptide transporter
MSGEANAGVPGSAQGSGAPRGFLGQPPGFSTLFFTELWERFSYYGMRAILLLFLVGAVAEGGMGLTDASATAIYGLYTAGVYIMSMPGGWVADRLLGSQGAVLWGGSLIATGHLLLAAAGLGDAHGLFMLGLAVIVLGTGLLKPNISALVGQLHSRSTGGARDAAFTWFYMAINIGAMAGPIATGLLQKWFGWHVGFLAAAVGMIAGLLWFVRTRAQFGEVGTRPVRADAAGAVRDWRILWTAIGALALLAVLLLTGVLRVVPEVLAAHAMKVMVAAVALYFLYMLLFAGLSGIERRRIVVLLVLVMASTLFWAGYEQAGSSLTLFAERNTNRMIASFEFPAAWFQSVPALWVLICAPLLANLWAWLAARGRDLPILVKFALGLLGMGLGFLVMVGAAKVVSHSLMGTTASAGPVWLITAYLLHTLGELCLSPIGMSATTQLAPRRFTGQAMGLWFTSLAMGNLLASQLAGSLDGASADDLAAYFLRMFEYGAGGAVVLIVLLPLLKRWASPGQDDARP